MGVVLEFPTSHSAARARLALVEPQYYSSRRNYVGESTMLSPYITRGSLTLPEVRDFVVEKYGHEKSQKLIFELAWREYWQHEWAMRGDAIYKDIKRTQERVVSMQLPQSVQSAETGINHIDNAIESFYETGYLHNHERLWIAGLVCNIAQTHWWQPSKWMYYHLLDGDVASNSLSWQWVAGTFSSKKYLPSQSNINEFACSTQSNTIIDHSYDELATMPVPEKLTSRCEAAFTWKKPDVAPALVDSTKHTYLYHPWWINPNWHAGKDGNRVLVLEPKWFELWPISEKVTDFIVNLALDIPGMQIHIGSVESLNINQEKATTMQHIYTREWNIQADTVPKLFPGIPNKPYQSFMSFWKQCQKKCPNTRNGSPNA